MEKAMPSNVYFCGLEKERLDGIIQVYEKLVEDRINGG